MGIAKKVLLWTAVALAVLLLAIQFVPVDRSNPATQTQVPASAEARAVLERACYDCHSNETRWPWYSYVAPVSWLVAKDVNEGREKLNFSTWNLLSAEEQSEGFEESWEKVQEGEMPLWFYVPLHPSAKLSAADRAVLQNWASTRGTGSGASSGFGTGTEAGPNTDGVDSGTTSPGTGTDTDADDGTGANFGATGTASSTASGDQDDNDDDD